MYVLFRTAEWVVWIGERERIFAPESEKEKQTRIVQMRKY